MATTKSKRRRRLVWSVLAILVLAGSGTAYYFLRKQEKPIIVQTEAVSRRNLTETVVANGRIQPVVQVVINPEVSGEIIDLPVKEGQAVNKGDLLVKIKPDNYIAGTNSAYASYLTSLAGMQLAKANLNKADLEFQRNDQLFKEKLVSDSAFLEAQTSLEVARAQVESCRHQTSQAEAAMAKVVDDLSKTIIYSPICGTITKLKSQKGERVVGTAMMAGTEVMTVANLDDMEARVDIGEIDVVLMAVGQKVRIEVDSFRDRKFAGVVTDIANSSKTANQSGTTQEATKFEVKIRVSEKETFRPGMSVTTEIETRYRTNVLAVPIQSVTTRLPKGATNKLAGTTNRLASTNLAFTTTNSASTNQTRKMNELPKAQEVVFVVEGDQAKMVLVKRGISDDNYVEILEGLKEGQMVVSGGYRAINRELEEGKKVQVGDAKPEAEKKDL